MDGNRELAAILFSDVSDFTNTMDTDENMAVKQVLRHKEIVTSALQEYNGHLIKDMGDGLFIKFSSALASVQCAIKIREMTNIENFSVRIGIHMGDVITQNNDVFGSGVNIASRIQNIARSGSICISKEIWRQVKNQTGMQLKSLGKKAFKGVEERIEVFELSNDKSINPDLVKNDKIFSYLTRKLFLITGFILTMIGGIFWFSYSFMDIGLTNDYSASIAILEFKNISSDTNNGFFAKGLTEELINQLSKIQNLKVTPRTDIDRYTYDNTLDTGEIAKELDVEYIVEGSVRIVGDSVRVNAQLVDPFVSGLIWGDKYDDNLLNILQVQNEIARKIVDELNNEIVDKPLLDDPLDGIHLVDRKLSNRVEAIEYVALAYENLQDETYSKVENAKYIEKFLIRSIEKDPTYGETYALMALVKFILINDYVRRNIKVVEMERISDAHINEIDALIEKELNDIEKNIEIALIYDERNELALAEKVAVLHINSSINGINYHTNNAKKIFDEIADDLLEVALSKVKDIQSYPIN